MGSTYFIEPIAPVEANTLRVPAGPVTFGLEMRQLNPAVVKEFYEDRPDGTAVKDLMEQTGDVEDGGVSIHVFGTEDELEYLRFDCFVNGPHYHYVHPREDWQVVNEIDPVVSGDPFEWALERLAVRLPEMLRESGGPHLAESLDPAAVGAALVRLGDLKQVAEAGLS